jgi:hypothetical protein
MEKNRRINFTMWGNENLESPKWAMAKKDQFESYAVADAIARKNGLQRIIVKYDCNASGEYQYQATLGKPSPNGSGFYDTVNVWFSISA